MKFHRYVLAIAVCAVGGCSAFNDPVPGAVAGGVLGASAGTAAAAVSGGNLGSGAAWGGGIGAGVGLASGLSNAAERHGWFESDYSDEIAVNQEELRENNQRIERERQMLREREAQFPEPR